MRYTTRSWLRVLTGLSILLVIGAGCGGSSSLADPALPSEMTQAPLSIKIPVGGEKGVTYKLVTPSKPGDSGDPGDVDRGPESFAIDPDGTFWISDSIASRLLHVDQAGAVIGVINLRPSLRGAADDLAASSDKLYVFDYGEYAGLLVVDKTSGKVEVKYELGEMPRWALVTMWLTQAGEVVVHASGFKENSTFEEQVYLVLDSTGQRTTQVLNSSNVPGLGIVDRGPIVKNYPYDVGEFEYGLRQGRVYTDTIEWRGVTITGKRTEEGGFKVERALPNGDLLVLLSLSVDSPQIAVDQIIQHYRKDGTLIGQARVPLAENALRIPVHNHKTTPDGRIFTMINHPDHLEIREIRLSVDPLPRLLPSPPTTTSFCLVAPASASSSCVSRSTMIANAESYINNLTTITSANIKGAGCPRTRPPGLSTGSYSGVAYQWGGEQTIVEFNSAMARGETIGDTDRSYDSCANGIDCSAYVSKAIWQDSRLTTVSLPGVLVLSCPRSRSCGREMQLID